MNTCKVLDFLYGKIFLKKIIFYNIQNLRPELSCTLFLPRIQHLILSWSCKKYQISHISLEENSNILSCQLRWKPTNT